jgi:serine/threonine protein kinase
MELWGKFPPNCGEDDKDKSLEMMEQLTLNGENKILVPKITPKYADFVRRRSRVFREIDNMRKISSHMNVIRLENVLELTQESKCTIFLVMELANGGELFDRIKIDCGTRESTAKFFFNQLLEGVRHCHDQGVCHRDLKPENLLCQDTDTGTILKIADFGFSARFALESGGSNDANKMMSSMSPGATPGADWEERQAMAMSEAQQNRQLQQQQVLHTAMTPVAQSLPNELIDAMEPLRVLKSVVGSPFYVAPEVLQARGYDGPKADIWSLGVILYAMLAGNLPFGQELATCKRFRHFCKWVKDKKRENERFWEEPDLEYPPWLFPANFSALAKGLIVSMLHPEPAYRLTILQAMRHPLCYENFADKLNELAMAAGGTIVEVGENDVVDMHGDGEEIGQDLQQAHLHQSDQSLDSDGQAMVTSTSYINNDINTNIFGFGADNGQNINVNTFENVSSMNSRQSSNNDGSDKSFDQQGMFKMEEDGDYNDDLQDSTGVSLNGRMASITLQDNDISSSTHSNMGNSSDGNKESSSHGHTGNASPAVLSQVYGSPPPAAPLSLLDAPGIDDLVINSDDEEDVRGQQQYSDGGYYTHNQHNNNGVSMGVGGLPGSIANPPAFRDLVKRSTRFLTTVPAADVLEKMAGVLHQCQLTHEPTPLGQIQDIKVNAASYRLEVWAAGHQGTPSCAIQLYAMPIDMALPSPSGMSPALQTHFGSFEAERRMSGSGSNGPPGGVPRPLYLVEFIREQLEIFAFKRFYQWVRQRVSILVKRDYAGAQYFDNPSPMVDSSLMARFQQGNADLSSSFNRTSFMNPN